MSKGSMALDGGPGSGVRVRTVLTLFVCVGGIYGAYLTQGVVQEALSIKKFGKEQVRFDHLASLNAVQSWACFAWAFALLYVFKRNNDRYAGFWMRCQLALRSATLVLGLLEFECCRRPSVSATAANPCRRGLRLYIIHLQRISEILLCSVSYILHIGREGGWMRVGLRQPLGPHIKN